MDPDRIARIETALHDIQHSLVAANARQEAQDAKLDRVEAKVDAVEVRVTMVDDSIRGNGGPGLRAAHRSLEERVAGLAKVQAWAVGLVTTCALGMLAWSLGKIFA